MGRILVICCAVLILAVWLGLLLPQYAAWKNKRYKTVATGVLALTLSVVSGLALACYGGFCELALYGSIDRARGANELVLCILGAVFVLSTWFCLWYVYFRRSLEYIYIEGCSYDELKKVMSWWLKERLRITSP